MSFGPSIPLFLILWLEVGRRWRSPGHRIRPLVPARTARTAWLAVLVPAVAVTVVLGVLRAPIAGLVVAFGAIAAAGLFVSRASVFRVVEAQLMRPQSGMIVLEGRVGDASPLGKTSVTGALAALTLVDVAAVRRGRNVYYQPVGEVQDAGALELTTDDGGTFALDLDDAILELKRDSKVTVMRSAVPEEISSALDLGEDDEFRLREYVVERGDRITVLIAGAKAQARTEASSAYRSAVFGAAIEVPSHARPAIFEGTLADALANLRRKARGFEIGAAVMLGLGMAVVVWDIRVALLA